MRLPLWTALAMIVLSNAPALPRASLAAQEPRPGWEVTPFAGLLAFDQDFRVSDGVAFRGLKDSPVFGGRIGHTFGRLFGAEGWVALSTQSFDGSDESGTSALDIRTLAYVGEAVLHLASGDVLPFLAAGMGGLSFEVDADTAPDESATVLLASLGGGLKVPLSPSLLVRLDARDLLIRRSDRQVESFFGGDGEIRHNVGLSAGVSFRFGGPADVDHDGVYDDRDACPDTAPDLPVDARGCVPEIPEGPPPVKTDGDGDGVSDALDRCPSTPPGTVVDLDGCPVAGAGTSGGETR